VDACIGNIFYHQGGTGTGESQGVVLDLDSSSGWAEVGSEPLVSVIVSTFNRPDYLKAALDSVVAQSYRNMEIIVADDAGPDDLGPALRSFGDDRIRHKRNAVNCGVLRNIVGAIREARGKYVAILNDDDRWGPAFLKTLVPHLEEDDEIVIAFCDHYIIDAEGGIDRQATESRTECYRRNVLAPGKHRSFDRLALVDKSIGTVMGAVLRRAPIDWADFPDGPRSAYDTWIMYLATATGLAAYYVPERLACYRYHPGQQTRQALLEFHQGMAYCHEELLARLGPMALSGSLRALVSISRTDCGLTLLRQGRGLEARSQFVRALQVKLGLRPLVGLGLTPFPASLALMATRVVQWLKRRAE
jgi:hypothetical protein